MKIKKKIPSKCGKQLVNGVFVERDRGSHVTVELTAYHRNICKNQKEIFCGIIFKNTEILYSLELLASEPIRNCKTDDLTLKYLQESARFLFFGILCKKKC